MKRLVPFLFLLVGCATANTDNFKRRMDTYIGGDMNVVIERWGPPTATYQMPNGNMLYSWTREFGSTYIADTSNDFTVGRARRKFCKINFVSEPESTKIINWTAEGTDCKSN